MSSGPPEQETEDLTGRTLGEYTLLRRLGRGGMADVYLARQASLERNVALKILRPELARDESYDRRFHREAQSAAKLVQANIVQVYEVKKVDGYHFISQEYIHGRNLRQYLDRHGAVEPVMAITVLRQCAAALQKAADHHVIHRDIKPENIMLSTAGEVKVTDFGLARVNDDASRQALTQIGITMGTPLYMSPEQVEGGPLDSRSDIYSLGVTAYHMLAGHPPFEGDNALTIAVQQVKDEAPPLAGIRSDLPPELCELVHRMIAKDPAERPQTPSELLKELRKIKIDVDEDWDALIERLAATDTVASPEAPSYSQAKLAATQQLQTVMRGNIRSWWKQPATIVLLVALAVGGLVAGTVAATQRPPSFVLDIGEADRNEIPRKASVKEQYESAYWGTYALGSNEDQKRIRYWKAVAEYFPLSDAGENLNTTKLYHRLAKTRLGEVYLNQRSLPEALEIYDELESQEDVTDHFRMMGSAGKAIVYDSMPATEFEGGREEQIQKVRECLSRIGSETDLLNDFMRRNIEEIQLRLNQMTTLELDRS
jgi:serine/threonine protein kinase